MIQGKLAQDGSTGWIQFGGTGGVHVAVKGTWGGGTLTIEQKINNVAYPIQSSDDAIVQHTKNFDRHVSFEAEELFRLTLAGSTSPSLDFSISGDSFWAPV